MPRPGRHRVEGQISLHAGGVDAKGKVAIADLKRRRFIVDKICTYDIILRYDAVPGCVSQFLFA